MHMIDENQRFAITGDLLYPAALGAGIAWWVETFIHWLSPSSGPATGWSLLFGAFFILYHGKSFVLLRDMHSGKDWSYTSPDFAKDVIDCVALVLAFICLRFPGGKSALVDPVGVFVIAALIPAGALITGASLKPIVSWGLRLSALIVAGVGIWFAFDQDVHEPFIPLTADRWTLGGLIGLLFWYLLAPEHFGAEPKAKSSFNSFQVGFRTIFAGLVLIGDFFDV